MIFSVYILMIYNVAKEGRKKERRILTKSLLKLKEMMLIEPVNAISSWESYEYQGHIALYIALKNIYDLLQRGMSISGYDLQIEGEEDFSIRENNKYISIHQVKAGALNLDPNDKFSFIIGIQVGQSFNVKEEIYG